MKTLFILLLVFFKYLFCFSQNEIVLKKEFKLNEGIYLENLNFNIPWEIDFSKISTYGNPKITRIPNRGFVQIRWDSVRIVNNFKVDLYIVVLKSTLLKKKTRKVSEFRALIDSAVASNFTLFIKNLTGRNGNYIVNRKNSFSRWDIDYCRLSIGYDKHFGYFLTIINNKT